MKTEDQDVRIVFTASPKLSSRIIRWFTRSPVSHVFIEYPSGLWGGRWAAEATKDGVRKVIAKKSRHDVYAEFRCRFDVREGLNSISKYLGEDYDYVGVAFLATAAFLGRWFSAKVKNPMYSSKSQFCSEFITRFFQGSDLVETTFWDVEKSSPGRLYRYCVRDTEDFEFIEKVGYAV